MSCQRRTNTSHQEWLWSAILLLAFSASASAQSLNFNTFVSSANIDAAESSGCPYYENSAIAFNYAGNKFVGSVYFCNQLYQTSTTGGTATTFGSPLPDASVTVGEVVVGASLGQGGFPTGDIYSGSQANGHIYHFANSGGAPTLFANVPVGDIRQIFFDPGSTFGGNMLVTTSAGDIYEVTSAGVVSLLASVGEDTEGLDIATTAWGPYAGYLLVGSEGSGTIRLIPPSGSPITVVLSVGSFPHAEGIAFVPLTLNVSDPLEGYYVSNYAQNVQFAPASNFTSLLGDAVVTDELGGSTAWDVHYNSGTGTFTQTPFAFPGNQINQFEDGIFVSPQREADVNTGYIEVCKQSNPAAPVTGTFSFTVTASSTFSTTLQVPVGECSGPIQVPSGTVTVTETPQAGVAVSDVSAYSFSASGSYIDQLIAWPAGNPANPDAAQVNVVSGGVALETITTFTNSSTSGQTGLLKICKIAGSGIDVGTPFTFTATSPASSTGAGTKSTYSIEAGPAADGGYCVLGGTYPVGTHVTVKETLPTGDYASITVQPSANGGKTTANSVVATIGTGITEVTFTDSTSPPQCGPYTFTGAPTEAAIGSTFTVAFSPTTPTPTITATGPCTISGDVVTMTGASGTCVLTATWPASGGCPAAKASQKTVAEKSTKGTTTTAVTCSPNPSDLGTSVTCTATVTGEKGLSVTGTVAWSTDTGEDCESTSLTPGNPGTATCTTSTLPGGTDPITATYSGDSNNNTSAGKFNETVDSSGQKTPLPR